jgi:hypothetical protein
MVKPIELDPREALRNCGVHARQINEQIADADKQRSDAVAAGDLDAVRKINRRKAMRFRSPSATRTASVRP